MIRTTKLERTRYKIIFGLTNGVQKLRDKNGEFGLIFGFKPCANFELVGNEFHFTPRCRSRLST